MTANTTSGFLLLRLAVLIFVIGLLAAGVATIRLFGAPQVENLVGTHPTPLTEKPADVDNSILLPGFVVDESLKDDQSELEQQLYAPLRSYYATRDERLGEVRITTSEDEEHTTEVVMTLISAEETGGTRIEFFYDRAGDDRTGGYPLWTPSHLDNTQ